MQMVFLGTHGRNNTNQFGEGCFHIQSYIVIPSKKQTKKNQANIKPINKTHKNQRKTLNKPKKSCF